MLYLLMMILVMSFQKVRVRLKWTNLKVMRKPISQLGTDATNGKRQQKRRGPRTRGGISRVQLRQANEKEEGALQAKWKEQNKAPTVPPFTSDSEINVPLSDDANPLKFLDLFLDDAFYAYITTQTNIYADQYLAADPKLPPHSR